MMVRLRNWFMGQGWSTLLEILLVIALGLSLAHWTWTILSPRQIAAPSSVEPLQSQRPASPIKRNLFGAAQEGKGSVVVDASPATKTKLLGIISRGAAGGGRAIFALESGKPTTVEAGSQIVQGLVLKEVHSDHVLVARNGVIERMKLDRRAATKN
jgi:general secretion pathway protein C